MPTVIVTPPSSINVRVNQSSPKVVSGTSTFVGAADVQNQVNQIQIMAQLASDTANAALLTANSKYDKTGGTITGNVEITGNLYVDEIINANNETIDAGIF